MKRRIASLILVITMCFTTIVGSTIMAYADTNDYVVVPKDVLTNCDYLQQVRVSDDYLYLRTGPGTEYSIMRTLYRDTVLPVYYVITNRYDKRPWGLTTYEGQTGWISLNWTTGIYEFAPNPSSIQPGNYTYDVTVADDWLYLRTGPGTEYPSQQTIYKNTRLTITETTINRFDGRPWGRTYYDGKSGWVSLNWTVESGATYAASVVQSYGVAVNDSYLYFRVGPGAEYESMQTLYRDTVLNITETVINQVDGRPWGKTFYNGKMGWVSLNWTRLVSGTAPELFYHTASPEFLKNFSNGGNSNISGNNGTTNSGSGWYNNVNNGSANNNGNAGYNSGSGSDGSYNDYLPTGVYDVYVSDDYLYLRSGPGAEHTNLQTIYRDTILTITNTVRNPVDGRPWGETYYNGQSGWVSLDWTRHYPDGSPVAPNSSSQSNNSQNSNNSQGYNGSQDNQNNSGNQNGQAPEFSQNIFDAPGYPVVVSDEYLYLRTGPGANYDLLDTIYRGTILEIYAEIRNDYGEDWGVTEYNGQTGYIALRWTEIADY